MSTWITKEQDLVIVEKIVRKYLDLHGAEVLHLYAKVHEDRVEIPLEGQEWLGEMHEQFVQLYGKEQAVTIMHYVMGQFLRAGQSLH